MLWWTLTTTSCAAAPEKAAPATAAQETAAQETGPIVSAKAGPRFYGKPPRVEHSFDVTLRNPDAEPRWLVLPTSFPYEGQTTPRPGAGEVAEVQVFELSKAPRVVIGKTIGGEAWVLHLPGRETVTLRGLKIASWWETMPESVTLEVIVASALRLGDAPLPEAIGVPFASQGGAEVEAPRDAADPRALSFWHPADGSGVPLHIEVVSTGSLRVPLARP